MVKTTFDLPSLPLVRCAHQADPGEEMTPERVAALLLADDVFAAASAGAKAERE